MVKNYYIFRHGQTLNSKFHLPYGKNDLTAEILLESIPVTKRIGEFLKDIPSDFNASSEFLRCKQTTEIIKEISGKEFVADRRLNELYQISFADFKDRINDFLSEINGSPKNQTIIVCTHGAVVAGLKHLILEGKFSEHQLFDYPKTGAVLCLENGKLREVDFNYHKSLLKSVKLLLGIN